MCSSVVSSSGTPVSGLIAPLETFGETRSSTRPSRVMRGVRLSTTPTSRKSTLSRAAVWVVVVIR